MSSLVFEKASAWARVPQLPPEVEGEAARQLIDFLKEVDATIEKTLAVGTDEAVDDLNEVWEFSRFNSDWLKFWLPSIGQGEVRITLFGGLVKIEETGIPSLWRMQMDGQESFILSRLPLSVRRAILNGDDKIGKIINDGSDVFAAPAIIQELNHELEKVNWDELPQDPAFMVELSGQPMSPGDHTALLSTLGTGDVEVRIAGFAESLINRTKVRGVWHNRLLNNNGKELLDSYVVAVIPPEVPGTKASFVEAQEKCRDLIQWVAGDLERGTIGEGAQN